MKRALSTVTLFTLDKHQFQTHPDITLEDTHLPLERSPKILGVIMDPSLSFHKHCNYVSDRIDKINNILKVLAGSSWGQEKETLLLTYNALVKFVASYAASVWSTNTSDSSFKKIQTAHNFLAHNAALRTATRANKMASIDHLHQESFTLKVKDHSDMLFVQYLVNPVCHGITTLKTHEGDSTPDITQLFFLDSAQAGWKAPESAHTRDRSDNQLQGNNILKERPPPISDEKQRLNRRQRCTLSQIWSGHCHPLQDNKHRVLG